MSNLEELTLNIVNENRTIVDGTEIHYQILVHMPRLYKFNFHIHTRTELTHLVHYLSSDDIQRTFTNIGYQHVSCIVNYITTNVTMCNVFSLPFVFDVLDYISNIFPPFVFSHVTRLSVVDILPFKHEFFVRIARFFPLLKKLTVLNRKSQSQVSDKLDPGDNQLYSVVEHPYLLSLCLESAHIDYVDQFLNETKTHLPRLMQLSVDYNQLTAITQNFTRDTTRLNCSKVKRLVIEQTFVYSKDFYVYFPLLESCSCYNFYTDW
jgi:hypothetical protein